MRVTRFTPSEPVQRGRLNSNTIVRLDGVESFSEVLAVVDELAPTQGFARLICTLDDVDQCGYTSGHASLDDALWIESGLGDDEDDDPAETRRADDARAVHVASQLDRPELRIDWEALPGSRMQAEEDIVALVGVNRDPDRVLDDVVLIQRVPVDRDDLAIAGVPNGYFTSDWNTFENHAIVRRMATHGYRHVGIGASLLGFTRQATPSHDEVSAIVADLVHLYGTPDAPAWRELTALLADRRLLLLGYTENFADMVEE